MSGTRALVVALMVVVLPEAAQGASKSNAGPAPAAAVASAPSPAPSTAPAAEAPVATPAEPPAPAPAEPPRPLRDDPGRPDSVEIQVRLVGDKLADGMKSRPGQGRYERWAVVPFVELGDEVVKRKLGQVVGAALETTLKVDHGFFCVERMRLSAVLKEIQLSQTGLLEESKAPEIGKMANADVLVTGSVGMLGDKYIVNAKAVSVEEAKVLAAAQVTVNAAGLVALSSDAVVLRTRSDAVLRSLLIPGWGQLYNRQDSKAGILMFAAAGTLAGGVVMRALAASAYAEYDQMTPAKPGRCAERADQFGACVSDVRRLGDSRTQVSNYLFIGLGAVWAYNLVDAALFGYVPDASTRSLYAGVTVAPAPGGVQVSGAF